jgi:hypothetical protein
MKPSRLPHEKKNIYFENLAFCRLCKKKKHAQHLNLHDTFEVNTQYSVIYIQVFFASP